MPRKYCTKRVGKKERSIEEYKEETNTGNIQMAAVGLKTYKCMTCNKKSGKRDVAIK